MCIYKKDKYTIRYLHSLSFSSDCYLSDGLLPGSFTEFYAIVYKSLFFKKRHRNSSITLTFTHLFFVLLIV